MVEVRVGRAPDGAIRWFSARGHAGFAPRGTDVVCAAVSALVQTAALGLQQRLGVALTVGEAGGRFECRMPPGLDAMLALRAQDVLETMCLGLREIAAQSPQHVRVRDAVDAGQ